MIKINNIFETQEVIDFLKKEVLLNNIKNQNHI